ncbi:DUF6541 family protein [Natrinema amylolyticum]|uniref:DUF6541 family protein n=1 Tax=Natrinema amylolyticum TaxID=2878679 RepID=UPI001CF93320|nr:DUF6541 family protein [Natrinema amylolyticum]
MNPGRKAYLRVLLLVGTALLSYAALVVATTPQATGYEISIYTAYPTAFWISIVLTIFVGQLLVLEDATSSRITGYWKRGYALLVTASGLLLVLPTLRYQYVMGRADTLTFAGGIDYVTVNHALQPDNYYPMMHLLAASLSFLTGIEPINIMQAISPIFSIAFLLGVYSLLRYLFPERREFIVVLPFASLLFVGFSHLHVTPYNLSFLLSPIVVLYCLKSQERNAIWSTVAMLVLVFATVFYHPLTGLLIVGFFAIAQVLSKYPRLSQFVAGRKPVPSVSISLIVLVVLFAWYSRFDTVILSSASVVTGRGPSQFEHVSTVADRVSPSLIDLLQSGIASYGMEAIVGSVTLVILGYLGYERYHGRVAVDTYVVWLAGIFLVSFAFGAVAFFLDVIFEPLRFTRYGLLAGGILVGFGYLSMRRTLRNRRTKQLLTFSMYGFLLILVFLSVFLLFPSPFTGNENLQVTDREIEGMEWALDNENETMPAQDDGVLQHRHIDYQSMGTEPTWEIRERDTAPPDHFGYDNNSTAGQSYETDTYLRVTELARIENPSLYPNYPENWRHTPSEYQRLENDSTVDHVYTNGEFDNYIVRSADGDSD